MSPRSMRAARKTQREKVATPIINAAESPIGWLFRRRDKDGNPLISADEFEAGERLRRDFTFAEMQPRVTADWSPTARCSSGYRGAGPDMTDNAVAAAERVRRALNAVGPELAGILIDVCCHLKGLEDAERKAGWPQRSGKVVLGLALSRLARHYGIGSNRAEPRADAKSAIRHWGDESYRPSAE